MPLNKLPYPTLDALIKKNIVHDEDLKTLQTIRLLSTVKKRGCLRKEELIAVCYWKSPRAIRLVESNHASLLRRVSKRAWSVGLGLAVNFITSRGIYKD